MNYGAAIARLFRLDDEGWRRHANPWSAWTRIGSAPAFFLAFWSIHWIGWFALAPIAAVFVWSFVNPRLFPPPARPDAWVSRAVFGERAWTTTPSAGLPARHRRGPHALNAAATASMLVFVAGLVLRDLTLALAGFAGAVVFKIWFLDRMALLFDEIEAD